MSIDPILLENIEHHIYGLLLQEKSGISEYGLLKKLAGTTDGAESLHFKDSFDSDLDLFQSHFLLFHLLYRLKQKLFAKEGYHVEISPLNIQLHTQKKSTAPQEDATKTVTQTIGCADPLALYYLDLSHLEKTDAKAVEKLLQRFYAGLSGPNTRKSALETLGLTDPVDDLTIKKRYRSLAMTHHPDRGGDTETLKAINQAMTQLIP